MSRRVSNYNCVLYCARPTRTIVSRRINFVLLVCLCVALFCFVVGSFFVRKDGGTLKTFLLGCQRTVHRAFGRRWPHQERSRSRDSGGLRLKLKKPSTRTTMSSERFVYALVACDGVVVAEGQNKLLQGDFARIAYVPTRIHTHTRHISMPCLSLL